MKFLFKLSFLFLLISNMNAQDAVVEKDSFSKIEGISIFKIGKTRKEIIPLAEAKLKMKTIMINSSEFDYDVRNGLMRKVIAILKPNPDIEFDYPYNYSFCPNTKVYFIKNYEVSGIKLKNIYLKFYNDTLIDFICDGDEVISLALKKLYGEPELKSENENSNCALDYTDKGFTKLNVKINENWYNGDVLCSHYSSNYYDATCTPRSNDYIYLYSISKKKFLEECENINKPDTTSKKAKKKINKLTEF